MGKKKKIAILGGAFDPITIGHLRLSSTVLEKTPFNEVWLMPCYAHNHSKQMTSFEHRKEMGLLALHDYRNSKLSISSFEHDHKLDGKSYFLLKKISESFPDHEFGMIIGMDNANTIDSWYAAEELKERFSFIIVDRSGVKTESDWWKKDPHFRVETSGIGRISSTEVRSALKKNQNIDPWVTPKVQKYIKVNHLYNT